jgi:uncharacterized protein YoxC
MTTQKTNNNKKKALDEALEFAQEIDKKIQDFNTSSAHIADKWQKRIENKGLKT